MPAPSPDRSTHCCNGAIHLLRDSRVDVLRAITIRARNDVDMTRALHVAAKRSVMLGERRRKGKQTIRQAPKRKHALGKICSL